MGQLHVVVWLGMLNRLTEHNTYMEVMDAMRYCVEQQSLRGKMRQRDVIAERIRLHHTLDTNEH